MGEEQLTESAWEVAVKYLSQSKAGIIILTIVVIIATTFPFWKWLYGIIKEKYEIYKKKKEEEEKEQKIFKENIKNIASKIEQLPEITNQIKLLNDDVTSIKKVNEEVKQSIDKVNNDMGILFDNDNDEFRIYLTQLQYDHIKCGKPMTREIRQTLRVRFDNYSKRGGNGWAQDVVTELLSIPVEPFLNFEEE